MSPIRISSPSKFSWCGGGETAGARPEQPPEAIAGAVPEEESAEGNWAAIGEHSGEDIAGGASAADEREDSHQHDPLIETELLLLI